MRSPDLQRAKARRRRAPAVSSAILLLACAPAGPPGAPPPPSEPAPIVARVSPPVRDAGPAILSGSETWRVLAAASDNPLRWAHHRALRRPAIAIDGGVLFSDDADAIARVDIPAGALRWRDVSRPALRWSSLAAGEAVLVASRRERPSIRVIDLGTGVAVDRPAPAKIRGARSIGSALVIDDECALEIVDARASSTIVRIEGQPQAVAADRQVCARPPQVVAVDGSSVSIVGWQDRRLQLLRVDRASGALLDAVALDPAAELRAEPTGASAALDRIASEWRRAALGELDGPRSWPSLLVRAAEAPALAEGRADAVREALIARGVPCAQVLAAGDPEAATARVEIVLHWPISCLL